MSAQVLYEIKFARNLPVHGFWEPDRCPFCGGEAKTYGAVGYYVACTRCGAESGVFDRKTLAVQAWNRRA